LCFCEGWGTGNAVMPSLFFMSTASLPAVQLDRHTLCQALVFVLACANCKCVSFVCWEIFSIFLPEFKFVRKFVRYFGINLNGFRRVWPRYYCNTLKLHPFTHFMPIDYPSKSITKAYNWLFINMRLPHWFVVRNYFTLHR